MKYEWLSINFLKMYHYWKPGKLMQRKSIKIISLADRTITLIICEVENIIILI